MLKIRESKWRGVREHNDIARITSTIVNLSPMEILHVFKSDKENERKKFTKYDEQWRSDIGYFTQPSMRLYTWIAGRKSTSQCIAKQYHFSTFRTNGVVW